MEQWIMVALTAVYVLATLFISFFNARSAKATRDQIKESHAQFIDANRAFVNVDFEIIRNGLLVLKITNNGRRTAKNVSLMIPKDFLDRVPNDKFRSNLQKLNTSRFLIGIEQTWYVALGTTNDFQKLSEKPLMVNFGYSDCFSKYTDTRLIDIASYNWCLLYDSSLNDIRNYMQTVSESVKKISGKISK